MRYWFVNVLVSASHYTTPICTLFTLYMERYNDVASAKVSMMSWKIHAVLRMVLYFLHTLDCPTFLMQGTPPSIFSTKSIHIRLYSDVPRFEGHLFFRLVMSL